MSLHKNITPQTQSLIQPRNTEISGLQPIPHIAEFQSDCLRYQVPNLVNYTSTLSLHEHQIETQCKETLNSEVQVLHFFAITGGSWRLSGLSNKESTNIFHLYNQQNVDFQTDVPFYLQCNY
jgi:hypothetical protein